MTLHLYVLRQLLVTVSLAAGGISLIVFPTIAVQAVLALQGVHPLTILRYVPYVIIEFVPYLLPLSFLLGAVATFGRLAADRELLAIRMAGLHPGRLLIPGLLLAGGLSLVTHWLLANVSPEWKFVQTAYLAHARETAFRSIGRGTTEVELDEFYLKAGRQDAGDDRVFHDVIMNLPLEDGELAILSRSVSLAFDEQDLILEFEDFQAIRDNVEYYNRKPVLRLPLDQLFPQKKKNRQRASHLSTSELHVALAGDTLNEKKRHEFVYEVNRRRALSSTYFIFLLIGLPTGIFLRRGTQLAAFTGAVGYAFLYYVLDMRLGEWLTEWGLLSPALGAWATNVLFLAIGIVLTFRALWR